MGGSIGEFSAKATALLAFLVSLGHRNDPCISLSACVLISVITLRRRWSHAVNSIISGRYRRSKACMVDWPSSSRGVRTSDVLFLGHESPTGAVGCHRLKLAGDGRAPLARLEAIRRSVFLSESCLQSAPGPYKFGREYRNEWCTENGTADVLHGQAFMIAGQSWPLSRGLVRWFAHFDRIELSFFCLPVFFATVGMFYMEMF